MGLKSEHLHVCVDVQMMSEIRATATREGLDLSDIARRWLRLGKRADAERATESKPPERP